jgi:lipopolysaccharide transport system ATP-binding protein
MKHIIEVNHLTSLKETALNTLRRFAFLPAQERERFKVLGDISFHIEQGKVTGIIGHNGK